MPLNAEPKHSKEEFKKWEKSLYIWDGLIGIHSSLVVPGQ